MDCCDCVTMWGCSWGEQRVVVHSAGDVFGLCHQGLVLLGSLSHNGLKLLHVGVDVVHRQRLFPVGAQMGPGKVGYDQPPQGLQMLGQSAVAFLCTSHTLTIKLFWAHTHSQNHGQGQPCIFLGSDFLFGRFQQSRMRCETKICFSLSFEIPYSNRILPWLTEFGPLP